MIMKYLLIIWLFVFINFSCQSNVKNENKVVTIHSDKKESAKIEGTIGIVTTNESYQFGEKIFILNKDKQPIQPIVIKEEYQILALRCLSEDDNYYEVELPNKEIGYLEKHQKIIKFQTWEEHILSLFSVGFNYDENIIKTSPNNESESIRYESDEFYHPSQIKEEWLQVKWGSEGSWNYGWIKWREKEKLLIELFYFA